MGKLQLDDIYDAAVAQAHKSTMQHRHGAVIVGKGGEVLAKGYNQYIDYFSHQWSCHAEISAIMNLKKRKKVWQPEDLTMIVVRVGGKKGLYTSLSKPCCNCKKEIEKLGIARVFYSM
jgi:deoxycytidylate deaminase